MKHLYLVILAHYAVIILYSLFIIHIVRENHLGMFRRWFVGESIRQAAQRFGADFQLPCLLKKPVCLPFDVLMDKNSLLYYNALTPRELKKLHVSTRDGISALLMVRHYDIHLETLDCFSRSPGTDFRFLRSYDANEIRQLCRDQGLDPAGAPDRLEVLDLIMQDCMGDSFAAPFLKSSEALSRLLNTKDE